MPKQASVWRWIGFGALIGLVLMVATPGPYGPLASALSGIIGGALFGGFAAGVRNAFTGPKRR